MDKQYVTETKEIIKDTETGNEVSVGKLVEQIQLATKSRDNFLKQSKVQQAIIDRDTEILERVKRDIPTVEVPVITGDEV